LGWKHLDQKLTLQKIESGITLTGAGTMDDLDKYIEKRKRKSRSFARSFESGYRDFKIGAILKHAREESGLTQDAVARKLNTKKTAISRIENHAEDIKLSTIERFAHAVGKEIKLQVV
jgi:HTH-type transcriptional regulator / antitoxin HipB